MAGLILFLMKII